MEFSYSRATMHLTIHYKITNQKLRAKRVTSFGVVDR